jgi:uncharacterized protein YraI
MIRALLTATLGVSISTLAVAADGYVTGNVNLRAGPDPGYPSVAMLSVGTPVAIEGCVDGWSWCDVTAGNNRGWMAGNFLQEDYQGRRVLVPAYGVQIGIPIVSFVFATYWDDHYRNRSWYGNRQHWSQIKPQYQAIAVSSGSAHGPTDEARHSGVSTAPPSQHSGPSNTAANQHAVPTKAGSPENPANHTKPTEPSPAVSKAATQPKATEPKAQATEPKASEPKTQPQEMAAKAGPEPEASKDKDQH